MNYTIRCYVPADESSWLRCRVLSFLGTSYYDDVLQAKPPIAAPGVELVAVDDEGTVVGLMDTVIENESATIDTIAVHPDHQHQGLGRYLLEHTCSLARQRGARTLDAWTRDDADTLRWYRAVGFTESDHYLHVYASQYASPEEPEHAIAATRSGLRPVAAFFHASLDREQQLRREFTRVHVCRRFAKSLPSPPRHLL
ncbi:GNAT family N-acetyltransferase [Nocardiopsis sp. CC223A]|uniref:GNAT family N-acetyltransferase n=1 Tax=Nocardiopsis sp. CC223A TaxID=3044051 RepID=UPI00278BEC69|nr:GNAT family N-acetyltransferase [Nocardiopsis sp. CC223A]